VGYVESGTPGKGDKHMANQEIRATHEEVESFVAKLRDFHGSLSESEQAMLETVLQSAQGGETGGYGIKRTFSIQGGGWEDLVGWIESQGGEDTQGFGIKRGF
jgi:hypothetical protein